MIVDLFSGPDGWRTGLAMLGHDEDSIGVEWNEDAAATAIAAGHKTHVGDLTLLATDTFGPFSGLLGSPPCPAFSTAGKRKGLDDLPRIYRHIERIREAGRWLHYSREGWHDDTAPLVLEPLRWALEGMPEWIALEQVPAVLPCWEAFAGVLRDHGYLCDTGILSAEQYGVPQTRKRAILVARRHAERPVRLPEPTHQAYTKRKPFDPDSPLPRWVSMAEALGWGMTERPYVAVAAGTSKGGTDPMALGGSGARRTVLAERDAGRWQFCPTNVRPNSTLRDEDEPAPTLAFGHDHPRWMLVRMNGAAARSIDHPAPTITGNLDKGVTLWTNDDRPYAPGQDRETVRVTINEAAVLQSFPADYPWQGKKGSTFQQVGNAVPPLLSAAVTGNLLNINEWRDVCMSLTPPREEL